MAKNIEIKAHVKNFLAQSNIAKLLSGSDSSAEDEAHSLGTKTK